MDPCFSGSVVDTVSICPALPSGTQPTVNACAQGLPGAASALCLLSTGTPESPSPKWKVQNCSRGWEESS